MHALVVYHDLLKYENLLSKTRFEDCLKLLFIHLFKIGVMLKGSCPRERFVWFLYLMLCGTTLFVLVFLLFLSVQRGSFLASWCFFQSKMSPLTDIHETPRTFFSEFSEFKLLTRWLLLPKLFCLYIPSTAPRKTNTASSCCKSLCIV